MIEIENMKIFVHPNAEKHGLNEQEVADLWFRCYTCTPRTENILLALSEYKGRDYELIAERLEVNYFVVYHCFTPPTKKFLKEIEKSY